MKRITGFTRIFLFICLFFLFCCPGTSRVSAAGSTTDKLPPRQLGIAPPRIEADFSGPPINESITIYNYNDKPKEMRLSLVDVSSLKNGVVLQPTEQSLSRWTIINPKHFVIEPNSSQVVRVSIRPKVKLAKGDHFAILRLQQVIQNRKIITGTNKDGQKTMAVALGSNYGLPIIIHAQK